MTTATPFAAARAARPGLLARFGVGGGVLAVAAGSVVSGLTAYGFLIVAARHLGPIAYSGLSAVWTLVFLVGPSFFGPLEQEVCRAAVARRSSGDGDRPAVVRGAQVGGVIVVAVLIAVVAGAATL